MRFDIITAVPELLESPLSHSILKRVVDKGILQVFIHNIRDFSSSKHRQIDDYQFGGGAGMVLMIEPIVKCIEKLQSEREYDEVIFLTPDGDLYNQNTANRLSLKKNLIILCGHYKGIDERIREHYITKEISIGDYVLTGGEIAATVLIDSIGRLLPGAMSDETSALTDSFQDGILSPPVYTRPAEFNGWKVPEILLSGHEAKIEEWRYQQAVERTKERRPKLLKDKD
ncbi:MAG: tRNA (guanosine(37)-N1)-methyltransferase TrmD [Chitinophagales bacterium]|nr:tRNA (guanosine(37)-N1)-methyltransferase TrmD [Chitinophagales bacterium]